MGRGVGVGGEGGVWGVGGGVDGGVVGKLRHSDRSAAIF